MIATYTAEQIRADGDHMPRGGLPRYFNANRLDDLALVERRVCEALMGAIYARRLMDEALKDRDASDAGGNPRSLFEVAATATPDQRRRALIVVLDAHPEIETPVPVNGEDHED